MGYLASANGVSPDPAKTHRVKQWPMPTSVKETQQFLGLASYYRRFVKDFSTIASPLHKLSEKKTQFRWSNDCQVAFDCLKSHLLSAPILVLPDWSKPFILDTDASDLGIGAVLSQIHNDKEHVIAYASRTLTKAERNYCVTKKELLAVVTFLQHFRPYLLGAPFTIRTDHGVLAWIHKFKEPEGQIARWLQKLQEYQFSIIHRPGRLHNNADAMSRIPCKQCGIIPADEIKAVASVSPDNLLLCKYSSDELRAAQLDDPYIGPVLRSKETSTPSPSPKSTCEDRRLWQLWDQLTVLDGLLYRQFADSSKSQYWVQLVVPKKYRSEILAALHDGVAGGHLGQEKTFSRVRERFYWPGYFTDTSNWCQTCASCATRKPPSTTRRAPLGTIVANAPMQVMATDIVGPFPESIAGNSYVLVVTDYFTRWMETFAIPNQEAVTVANKLVDEVFM